MLTFWYEFASTYSYLSAMRVDRVASAAGVSLRWRPFLLGPIFGAQGWGPSPFTLCPKKGAYMWRDLARRAAAQGLPPITQPDPFPQNGLTAARVATLGLGQGWGAEFTRAAFQAQFAEGRSISDAAVLTGILEGLGLPGSEILAQVAGDDTVKAALRHATEEAMDAGLFGAPSFTTPAGELFWGDDRLEDAIAWVKGRDIA